MGKRTVTRRVVIAPAALEDLNWWRRTNPKRADRVRRMLEAVLLDPFGGIGKPEPLRGLPNTWSRRIDQRHRLVYRVFDDRIELVAAHYQYDEYVIRATNRLKDEVIFGNVLAPVLG